MHRSASAGIGAVAQLAIFIAAHAPKAPVGLDEHSVYWAAGHGDNAVGYMNRRVVKQHGRIVSSAFPQLANGIVSHTEQ
ncbi:MAG: hypothetical protein WD097_07950 [Balneolales bacterium]